jgi:hypothetical protein
MRIQNTTTIATDYDGKSESIKEETVTQAIQAK